VLKAVLVGQQRQQEVVVVVVVLPSASDATSLQGCRPRCGTICPARVCSCAFCGAEAPAAGREVRQDGFWDF